MAFKPNYNQQRSQRTRAKEQKKQEKLERRQEDSKKAGDQPPVDADQSPEGESLGS